MSKSIQEQIKALTQELRPYPKRTIASEDSIFWYFNGDEIWKTEYFGSPNCNRRWNNSLFASTNKAEVEEYADCYRRLKLYQLLEKKAEKEFPIDWSDNTVLKHATDFNRNIHLGHLQETFKECVLGGVYFARNEDRLEALRICGIDAEFQKKCAKYGLGGA